MVKGNQIPFFSNFVSGTTLTEEAKKVCAKDTLIFIYGFIIINDTVN